MAYKAIIFDVDGTAVPLGSLTASSRLRQAISTAQGTLQLAAATGRSVGYAQPVFESLGLRCPSVIMGGSAILDPVNGEVVWSKAMAKAQSDAALEVLKDYEADIWISTDPTKENYPLPKIVPVEPIYTIWALSMEPAAAQNLATKVRTIPHTTAHNTPSWAKDLVDVHITHVAATKEHAIKELVQRLNLRMAEVIGVGDSANDIPIFQAVGHRIAMASGAPELQALADEIAPPLEDDGLAQIIEKYAA